MPPTLEDVLLGVNALLAPAMRAAGFARIEVVGLSHGGVGMPISEDPVAYLRTHGGQFPEARWWHRQRARGRIETVAVGFEHGARGEEQWLEYNAVSGVLDTSAWFEPTNAGAEDSTGRVESHEALHRRLRLAAQKAATA